MNESQAPTKPLTAKQIMRAIEAGYDSLPGAAEDRRTSERIAWALKARIAKTRKAKG